MIKKLLLPTVIIFALLATGCLKQYRELRLKSNLSGDFSVKIITNLDAIFDALARVQAPGAPEETIAAMKEGFRQQLKSAKSQTLEQDAFKEKLKSSLPEGITLSKCSIKQDKAKYTLFVRIGFKHIKYLKDLSPLDKAIEGFIEQSQGQSAQMIKRFNKDGQRPFMDVKIEQRGKTIVIKHSPVLKPGALVISDEQKQLYESMKPGAGKMVDQAMKGAGFFYRVRYPYKKYKVINTNGEKKKHVLDWRYTPAQAKKVQSAGKELKNLYVKLHEKG